MPNADTFEIQPIRDFVERHWDFACVSVDPFARNFRLATHTNDINGATAAEHHLQAPEFLWLLARRGVKAKRIIFDPPYSPTRVKRAYHDAGLEVGREDTQTARLKKACRDAFRALADDGCVVLSFGWNTVGMGPGWETLEVLIVDHGGDHNATLCMAQRKL